MCEFQAYRLHIQELIRLFLPAHQTIEVNS